MDSWSQYACNYVGGKSDISLVYKCLMNCADERCVEQLAANRLLVTDTVEVNCVILNPSP